MKKATPSGFFHCTGSRNILKFNKPGLSWDGAKAALKPDTRRWNKQRWEAASTRCSHQELLLAA